MTVAIALVALLAGAGRSPARAIVPQESPDTIVLRCGRLIDGRGDTLLRNRQVVVRDGRVVSSVTGTIRRLPRRRLSTSAKPLACPA